jgi:uncharacterized protein
MNHSRPQLFGMLAGLFLAVGLVLSSMLGTTAWLKIKNSQFISVKGSTHKDVASDLVIWSGNFYVEAPTLLEAQKKLQGNRAVVGSFLNENGVTNFTFDPISIEEIKATLKTADGWAEQRTAGFHLTQGVRVETGDVDRMDKLDTTPLVEQGVIFFRRSAAVHLYRRGSGKNRDARRRDQRCARARRTNRRARRAHDRQFT